LLCVAFFAFVFFVNKLQTVKGVSFGWKPKNVGQYKCKLMSKYKALPITTEYWKPKTDYLTSIIKAVDSRVVDGDFVVVSEKAVSTALGHVVDENKVVSSVNARFLAGFWMRKVWGYPLGVLCRFGPRLLARLRSYPLEQGSRHKQLTLQYAGLGQALLFGSEGAIDGSNLPYSLVSLPLKNVNELAWLIRGEIRRRLGKSVCVIIVDTDKTYRLGNFYFTPRPHPYRGICSISSFALFAYVAGKTLKLKRSSTPLAVAGCRLGAAEALKIANIADRVRGAGSGATVWDMASRFSVQVNDVTWGMLAQIEHKPLVLVRKT
jgi:F420-0:gamma-glutamyl ligase-like protein